jgi:ADP-heptose:LPS heptosyltransferase
MSGARILLVRPDHLGDVLLTLPAVVALRTALPRARITYLVSDALAEVPSRCHAVDEVLTLPFPAPDASFDPPGWRDVVGMAAPRLAGHFDVAVLLRPEDPWSGALVRAAGIPLRVGYAQRGTRAFLTHMLPPESPGRHAALVAADVLHLACSLMGAPMPPVRRAGPLLVPTVGDRVEADEALAHVRETTTEQPVILHPGSGWRLKNWPVRRWGALAETLAHRHGWFPLVLGSTGEERLCDGVVAASNGNAVALPWPLSLGGLAAMHRGARVVVSVDNGAVHLAALVGTPVVALFGPGDPRTARPWCAPRRTRVVRVDIPCSPCGRMHDPPCGAEHAPDCVIGVSVGLAAAAVEELLSDVPTRSRLP